MTYVASNEWSIDCVEVPRPQRVDNARMSLLAALMVLPLLLLVTASGPSASRASRIAEATAYSPARLAAPPVFPTADAKPLAAGEEARRLNALVPAVDTPLTPAPSLNILGRPVDFSRAADCLAAAVYYEAASEGTEGQRAVAQVVLNRVRHPAFPKSICGVVFQGSERSTGCQFSFTCDGSLARTPSALGWMRARTVAQISLAGYVESGVGYATHYHTVFVMPYWSSSLTKLRTIGAHIFYKWKGAWGEPAAFQQRYAGSEPNVTPRASAEEKATLLSGEAQLDGSSDLAVPAQDAVGPTPSSPVGLELKSRVLREPLAAKPRPLELAPRTPSQPACDPDATPEREPCLAAAPQKAPIKTSAFVAP